MNVRQTDFHSFYLESTIICVTLENWESVSITTRPQPPNSSLLRFHICLQDTLWCSSTARCCSLTSTITKWWTHSSLCVWNPFLRKVKSPGVRHLGDIQHPAGLQMLARQPPQFLLSSYPPLQACPQHLQALEWEHLEVPTSDVLHFLGGASRRRQWHPTPVLLPGKSHG